MDGDSQVLFVSAAEYDRIREGRVTYGRQILFVSAEEYDRDPGKYRRLIKPGTRVVVVHSGTGSEPFRLVPIKETSDGRTDPPTSA